MKRSKLILSAVLVVVVLATLCSVLAGCASLENGVNTRGADAFINWMSSDEALNLIKTYGTDSYGEALFTLDENVQKSTSTIEKATKATKTLRISTTTSVNDSGLLGAIVPVFEEKYGYDVEISSAGTGAAIQAARDGNADMILVHSKSAEETFIGEGYARTVDGFASERVTFMYNYFVVAGTTADPANIKNAATVKDAFQNIANTSSTFISRGDKSGTHNAELKLWAASLNITSAGAPAGSTWYVHAGQGMGACLTMANEQNAYVLSDKATFLSYKKSNPDKIPNLSILYEQDASLKNTYSMIAVNPAKFAA